ncbi:MAG: hypothetical protein JWM57_2661 [Phycisphaerales bacterium]|nr:hypothetical protein [Phycisphaerales bacterium]
MFIYLLPMSTMVVGIFFTRYVTNVIHFDDDRAPGSLLCCEGPLAVCGFIAAIAELFRRNALKALAIGLALNLVTIAMLVAAFHMVDQYRLFR